MFLRRTATLAAALTALSTLGTAPAPAAQHGVDLGDPHAAAHAHNDYEHDRPLLDALEHGFTSVEADVWLVDGELLVAHDREDVRAGATLESLYLEPLDALVKGHGGSVYPGWEGQFQLLIDIKSEAGPTYAAIEEELAEHRTILTRYTHGKTKAGAVAAVISGNRPLSVMSAAEQRFGFYDGRASDLGGALPSELMPLISNNWQQLFSWRGVGDMPAAEREKLTAYVAAAHAQGARVRFWATPDLPGPAREAVWAELLAAGVDHINTDDLAALERFLAERG
ncbi:phosphatidylinositol-specific phospholipase C/glycerophosphodiester phosphodiesterase family protein [Arthrobacter sp. MSA 4-2]|uniref:phosphatidylinositol-specific phospholipase C/glycerophosphodiester phosphodiesterase family protein n=1 Tax=Arthrobacter sp. MSA 4-2 TaxID=2794349 RepID=UPI0018E88861|nr:phosphatidylinositol-specific phospholipase C/glycerophosphodiester phosphodiesterase family protein [Arthrobacter sp. MSA 4-2]MBJ2120553.1 phosphatidylinositol-specific phospholipase C/glycerophosphodiester phosphodiesterase family protein [Arthrobacter sp. MSA 4-2]